MTRAPWEFLLLLCSMATVALCGDSIDIDFSFFFKSDAMKAFTGKFVFIDLDDVQWVGSGAWVGENLVLTAAHNLFPGSETATGKPATGMIFCKGVDNEKFCPDKKKYLGIHKWYVSQNYRYSVEVDVYSPENDYALVFLSDPEGHVDSGSISLSFPSPFAGPPPNSTVDFSGYEGPFLLGYPGCPKDARDCTADSTPIIKMATSRIEPMAGGRLYKTSFETSKGWSGSPLYLYTKKNPRVELIGLHVGTDLSLALTHAVQEHIASWTENYFIQAPDGRFLIAQQGPHLDLETDPPEEGYNIMHYLWVLDTQRTPRSGHYNRRVNLLNAEHFDNIGLLNAPNYEVGLRDNSHRDDGTVNAGWKLEWLPGDSDDYHRIVGSQAGTDLNFHYSYDKKKFFAPPSSIEPTSSLLVKWRIVPEYYRLYHHARLHGQAATHMEGSENPATEYFRTNDHRQEWMLQAPPDGPSQWILFRNRFTKKYMTWSSYKYGDPDPPVVMKTWDEIMNNPQQAWWRLEKFEWDPMTWPTLPPEEKYRGPEWSAYSVIPYEQLKFPDGRYVDTYLSEDPKATTDNKIKMFTSRFHHGWVFCPHRSATPVQTPVAVIRSPKRGSKPHDEL